MNTLENMVLYAWVGEDELGSGEVGLKQGATPCGIIPLVACKENRMDQKYIVEQMAQQARVWGKTIRLAKFTFDSVILEVK